MFMRSAKTGITALAAGLLAISGCGAVDGPGGPAAPGFVPGDGDDDDATTDDDDTPFVETSGLKGMVRDVNGMPLAGVSVTTNNGISGETAADGTFSFVDLPEDQEGAILVNFSLDGYARTQQPFEILRDVHNTLLVSLALVDFEQTFASDAGLEFSIEDGGTRVTLPAGQYVDATGAAYTGDVHVEATVYDVFSDELYATPGDFTAIDIAGSPQILESYGMFQVNLTDPEGNELNLDLAGDGQPHRALVLLQGTEYAAKPPRQDAAQSTTHQVTGLVFFFTCALRYPAGHRRHWHRPHGAAARLGTAARYFVAIAA